MREIILKKSIRKNQLVFKTGWLTKILNWIPKFILLFVGTIFIISSCYLVPKGELSSDFLFISGLFALFIIWMCAGELTKGNLIMVDKISPKQVMTWIENQVQNRRFKLILNHLNEGYMGLRTEGISTGSFHRDIYIIIDSNKVFVSSIGVGTYNDASPFNYFSNRSKTQKIVKEINSVQHTV